MRSKVIRVVGLLSFVVVYSCLCSPLLYAVGLKNVAEPKRADLSSMANEMVGSSIWSNIKRPRPTVPMGMKSFSCEPRCVDKFTLKIYDECVMWIPIHSTNINCAATGKVCHEGSCINTCTDTDGLNPSAPGSVMYSGKVTYYDPEAEAVKTEVDHCKVISNTGGFHGFMIYEEGCRDGVDGLSEAAFEEELKRCPDGMRCFQSLGVPAKCVSDPDNDGVPNYCNNDNCPGVANPDQTDTDGDGIGDVCEADYSDRDDDGDGTNDNVDNCLGVANADQVDSDGDCLGNACDNCPLTINAQQYDLDNDNVGDICDNCSHITNADQADIDKDGVGDVCCTAGFPDPALEEAVRYAVITQIHAKPDGEPIYCAEAAAIESLGISGGPPTVSDLSGIENCRNLRDLHANWTNVLDFTPIASLQGLEVLSLNHNGIEEINFLTGLIQLRFLYLNINDIREIESLSSLSNLVWLELSENSISNIDSLAGIAGMRHLKLWGNPILSINALSGLVNLWFLDLDLTLVEDLSPLRNLRGLTNLYVSGGGFDPQSLYSLPPFEELEELSFGSRLLNDDHFSSLIEFLLNSHKLIYLRLDGNMQDISAVTALNNLPDLFQLALHSNYITNLQPLHDLQNIRQLEIRSSVLTDLDPISGLSNLEALTIEGNSITSLQPLANLNNLGYLALDGSLISDLQPLSQLQNLRLLIADGKIRNINSLSNLQNISSLTLVNNCIEDILPLLDGTIFLNGGYLNIRNNPLSDLSRNVYISLLEQTRNVDVDSNSYNNESECSE